MLIDDDVAVQDSLYTAGRRGVGATVLAEKIAGAAAERGDDLAAVAGHRPAGEREGALVRRRAVLVHPARRRARPSSTSPKGRWRWASASTASRGASAGRSGARAEIAELMLEAVLSDLEPADGASVLPFVNGMGGTPQLELYLLYGEIERRLRERGLRPERRLVGQLHHLARDGGGVAHAARAG